MVWNILSFTESVPALPCSQELTTAVSPGPAESSLPPHIMLQQYLCVQDIPGRKDGRCVRVTTLPPSCAECLEILEP